MSESLNAEGSVGWEKAKLLERMRETLIYCRTPFNTKAHHDKLEKPRESSIVEMVVIEKSIMNDT